MKTKIQQSEAQGGEIADAISTTSNDGCALFSFSAVALPNEDTP